VGKQRFSRRSRKSGFRIAGEGDSKEEKAILNEEKNTLSLYFASFSVFRGPIASAIPPERVV
jgi:hypothetical protein